MLGRDYHNAGLGRQNGQIGSEVDVRSVFDDDVESSASRRLTGSVQVAILPVIERMKRSVALDQFETFGCSSRAHGHHSVHLGQLTGGQTDGSAGSVHQNTISGFSFGAVGQEINVLKRVTKS